MDIKGILYWKKKIQKALDDGNLDKARHILGFEMTYKLFDEYTDAVTLIYHPKFDINITGNGTLEKLIEIGEFKYNKND